jgi:tetratricopeptide (TPR) repeat protein/DNA-binding SARP family transcriptional activator
MQFQLLGPLELWSAGERYELGSPKELCVLAILLLTPGTPVPAEVLIDRLWGERPPSKAREGLRAYVTRLRGRLSAADDQARLQGRADGYLLDVDLEAVDLYRFRRLRRQARAVAASGETEHAVLLLREADALWHGQALAGLPGDWMARMRGSLEEERRAAILERVELELELGRHADLLGELGQLAAQYELDEAVTACQMTALYRSGRQADALNLYLDVHRRLIDQGIEPGPELSALHQRILRRDPELAITPAFRQPGHAPQPNTLPPEISDFIGRADELSQLTSDHELAGTPMIKIIEGMPGVGKTALAVQLARQMRDRYPDAQLYLNFYAHDQGNEPLDPADALHRLLEMLKIPAARIPGTLDGRAELWRTELTRRRAVVILDDVLSEEDIRPALPTAGNSLTLITTRKRLHGLDDARAVGLDVLPANDAITLFTQIANAERARDPDEVAEATRLCGGLPLAIRLAAGSLRQERPSGLTELIEELSRPYADRDRTGDFSPQLMSAFDLSYQRLTISEQRFFRMLGISPCLDITCDVAAALCDSTPAEADTALAVLLDHHLLEQSAKDRFRFHDLVHAYAARATGEDPEPQRRRAVRRLLDYYLHTANRAERMLYPHRPAISISGIHPNGTGPTRETTALNTSEAARPWLEAEWRNILQAARHAARHEWKPYCVGLIHALAEFLDTGGYWDEAITAHKLALQACRDLDEPAGIARASLDLCFVSLQTGHHEIALQHAEEAAMIYRTLGDQGGQATALDRIGTIHFHSGHYRDALAYHEEAGSIYRTIDDLRGIAETLGHSGIVSWQLGRYPEATRKFYQALTLYGEANDRRGEAKTLNSLGNTLGGRGLHREALENYKKAFSIFVEIGGRQSLALLHNNIGSIYQYKGDYEKALAEYRKALAIHRDTGDPRGQAGALNDIGAAYQGMEQYNEALIHHQKAQLLAEEIGDSNERAIAFRGIASAHRGSGHHDSAFTYYRSALRLAREIGDPYQEAKTLDGIAETESRAGRPEMARIYWRQALDILQRLSTPESESVRIRLLSLDVG